MNKKEIRKMMRERRSQLLTLDVCRVSRPVIDRVLSMPEFIEADALYSYLEYNNEIITHPIIGRAWDMGKKVAVPKVLNKTMEFFYINSFDDILPGYNGILEPFGMDKADGGKVFLIMPGLAFDHDFNRIGYGGRFYDDYLARYADRDFFKVALAYDFQIIDHIDIEAHDVPVDAIVTSNMIYRRANDDFRRLQ